MQIAVAMNPRTFVLALLFLAGRPGIATAQAHDSTTVEHRAAQILAMAAGTQLDPVAIFNPAFLAKIPAAQIQAMVQQLTTQLGRVTSVKATSVTATHGGFDLVLSNGYAMTMTVSVEPDAPNRIGVLFFGAPTRNAATFADLMPQFQALPGHVSLRF